MRRFRRFQKYLSMYTCLLFIGVVCSLIPYLWLGVVFGFPAVAINSLILTILIKNKVLGGK
jgi:TM2 domain-containing membrane protein YozV